MNLHVSNEELEIRYKETGCRLNKTLLDKQNAWSNLEVIKGLHLERFHIEDMMASGEMDQDLLHGYWTLVQFELQDAWGFERDATFHKFWTIPGCTCPKMDNEDMYPSSDCYISGDCPIHGDL